MHVRHKLRKDLGPLSATLLSINPSSREASSRAKSVPTMPIVHPFILVIAEPSSRERQCKPTRVDAGAPRRQQPRVLSLLWIDGAKIGERCGEIREGEEIGRFWTQGRAHRR